MKLKKTFIISLGLGILVPVAIAQTQEKAKDYLRSSIYTVLLRSAEQDKHFDEECAKQSEGAALIKQFGNTDQKRAQNDTTTVRMSELPQQAFLEIAIPDQFNDFNQETRVVDFDEIFPALTDDDKKISVQKKKKSAFAAMATAAAKQSIGMDAKGNTSNDRVNEFGPSVLNHFANDRHVAPGFVAKWFDYGKTDKVWDTDYLIEMGLYDCSEEEKNQARLTGMNGLYESRGLELINNTYLIGVNLRFRSNAAMVAEGEKIAGTLLGSKESAQLLGAAASAAAGDGFTVEAVTYLFKLVWNQGIEENFYTNILDRKASIDDLVAAGICNLEYVGQEKSKARVRMSILNTKPISQLVRQATERAIDSAIAKLQEKYEVFRTSFPIEEVDGEGNVYAAVGMKEGISKGDEYEIVEQEEDPKTGALVWKKVGSVKAVDKKIWDNRAGAAEEAAEAAEGDKKDDDVSSKEAVALGKTMFAGAKKGQDYAGYYLRLKKKK